MYASWVNPRGRDVAPGVHYDGYHEYAARVLGFDSGDDAESNGYVRFRATQSRSHYVTSDLDTASSAIVNHLSRLPRSTKIGITSYEGQSYFAGSPKIYKTFDSPRQAIRFMSKVRESSATPMPMMKSGLASAGSLARSLKKSAGSPKLGGQMPKLGSAGSSFAAEMIQRVVDGEHPRSVAEAVMNPREIERISSNVSPSGHPTGHDVLLPGAQIGLRGPTHNGHHAVVSVTSTHVTLKNDTGHEEVVPIRDLDDHEVVHSLETF